MPVVSRPASLTLMMMASCLVGSRPLTAQTPRPGTQDAGTTYDLILRGGTVIDGTGAPRRRADLAITRGHIAAVGDLARAVAREEIDARGLFVAPGFINIHSHAVPEVLPTAVNMLTQGVTTELLNADGRGPADLRAQLASYAEPGLAVNIAASAGFNTVWQEVMGPSNVRPTPDDISRMRAMLLANLEQGAFGISAGLDYKPAYFATTDEAIAVLSVANGWRTFFPNHDRLTPETGFSSRLGMEETMTIANAAGMVPVFTHMKLQGHEQGTATDVLAMMDAAANAGRWVAADVYPYLAGQTGLASLIIPGWAQDGGLASMRERLADPTLRSRIITEAEAAIRARFGSAASILLPDRGRRLDEIMAEQGITSAGEAVVRILEVDTPAAIISFGAEEDLRAILRHPSAAVACDCGAWTFTNAHPRGYGTFPRVLGRYVRETGLLTWEQAIRKMTALPAAITGMVDRGVLAPGMAADITVFDSATVRDHATYEASTLPSEGIRHVLVNGVVALRDGVATGARGGTTLHRTRHMPSRPPVFDGTRQIQLRGRLMADTAGGAPSILVNVEQADGATAATGVVELTLPDGTMLHSRTLGIVQGAAEWATITGWLDTPSRARAFVLIADWAMPETPGTATVVIGVEGMAKITGRVATTPAN